MTDLTRCSLTLDRVRELAAVLPATRLTTLNLGWADIDTVGAQALAAVLPATRLKTLDLCCNPIGDGGAQALADVLEHTQLTALFASHTKIGDDGARALAAALPRTTLEVLDLVYNSIGVGGARALAAALPSSQLTAMFIVTSEPRMPDAILPRIGVLHLNLEYVQDLAADTQLTSLRAIATCIHLHPSRAWRRTLSNAGTWNESRHAAFPAPLRAIVFALLVVARSKNANTRVLSRGLWGVNTLSLYALFRWICRLNYFE